MDFDSLGEKSGAETTTEDSGVIDSWVVCQKQEDELRRNGYDGLVRVLKRILGDTAVTDIRTRQQLRECIVARLSETRGNTLLIVGHSNDLRRVDFGRLAEMEGLNVLELHFTTAEAPPLDRWTAGVVHTTRRVPYCSIREVSVSLSRATPVHLPIFQDTLNELIEKYREDANISILDPLLPLAVLADGFLVACPKDAGAWFRPGIDAALEASYLMGSSAAGDQYWTQLAENGPALERLREMIEEPADATPGFATVMTEARILWPDADKQADPRGQAALVHQRACAAVKSAWDVLTSKEGVALDGTEMRGLVETASVGFQVLAAGCL